MTADERIEALLGRAGQTITDLPKRYEQAVRNNAFNAADHFGGSLSMTQNFEDYILHLTDIIDRMETALENVCGERDYLCDRSGCEFCAYERIDGNKMPCRGCTVTKNLYEFAGVPEDWSADDETD